MIDSNHEFFQALADIKWPEIKPTLYRLYHDDQGRPLFYSQEHLDGKYIDITPDEYIQARMDVRVESGRLIRDKQIPKLKPQDHGTLCHPCDVSLVTQSDLGRKWALTK